MCPIVCDIAAMMPNIVAFELIIALLAAIDGAIMCIVVWAIILLSCLQFSY